MVTIPGPISEANRVRETFRYESALIAGTVPNDPEQLIPSCQLRSSSDASLTSFAQLAVLRLGVSRALVSLFDGSNQYVVAEATQDLSLRPRDVASGFPLWLSGTWIPRSLGICDHVLCCSLSPPSVTENELAVLVVDDLSQDARFRDQPILRHEWPRNRFYAGVAIRSRSGINIGVLSVFDDEPRNGLDSSGLKTMRELSAVIMNHFESKRTSAAKRLSEHMIRGIGNFVDGSTTLTRRKTRRGSAFKNGRVATRVEVEASNEDGVHGAPTLTSSAVIGLAPPDTAHLAAYAATGESASQIDSTTASPDVDEKQDPFSEAVQPGIHYPSNHETEEEATSVRIKEDEYTCKARKIFDKASKIIRESMEIDGVVFLETPLSSFSDRDHANWIKHGKESSSSSSSDENILSFMSMSKYGAPNPAADATRPLASNIAKVSDAPPPFRIPDKFLRKLLRRYPGGNIFNFDEYGSVQSSDSSSEETTSADADGTGGGDRVRKTTSSPRSRMKHSEQEVLMRMLPGARCIAFVPVWDPQEQRWFAGAFAYTKTHTRIFTARGDLSYLVAFGAVAMAEVSRLKATLADKSKMDMLGSLSHELRSPLHGVVFGSELLHETSLDSFQKDVLHTVEICGRTLLDTVNHLLDWTKINNLSTKKAARRAVVGGRDAETNASQDGAEPSKIAANLISLTGHVPIDMLVEEVVESVFVGHTYQKLTVARSAKASPPNDDRGALRRFDAMQVAMDEPETACSASNNVAMSLYIEPAASWTFYTQAGALRRVVMNLVGNSLKYTEKGFIAVRISQSPWPSPPNSEQARTGRDVRNVCIMVSDSGQGMSEDYLHNRLFVPFSQENRMSPGVGLGLSFVKRITSALGGHIQVQSRVGHGTTITVSLPLETTSASLPPVPGGQHTLEGDIEQGADSFAPEMAKLKGLRVRFLGFKSAASATAAATAKPARRFPAMGSQHDVGSTLTATCRKWLQMHVLECQENMGATVDVILCSQDHADRFLANATRPLIPTPVVIVCRNALLVREMKAKWAEASKDQKFLVNQLLEFISEPVGPRKLAKVLASSLERRQAMVSVSMPPELTPPAEPEPDRYLAALADGGSTSGGIASERCESPWPDPEDEQRADGSREGHAMSSKFLIVDDNPINIKILSSCMDKMGLEHDVARDGKEAVEAFKRNAGAYRCIFMDITMPVMNGYEATSLIRQQEREAELPACVIIALTGLASVQAQQEAAASGIDLFLTKPAKIRELKHILALKGLL